MKSFGRWVVALVALATLTSACTSQTKENGTSTTSGPRGDTAAPGLAANNEAASSTVGITADSINVAFIGVDFSALKSTGLVPDLGDQRKQVQSIVEDINANGGIAGRKIKLHFKLLSLIGGTDDTLQAACIEATQEFKAAVVILPPASARDTARCTSVTNKTLTLYATGMDKGLYAESQGRLFTPNGISIDRQLKGWADQMDQLGQLTGKKIGVVVGDQPEEFSRAVKGSLLPELVKLGHKPVQVVTLPCGSQATTSCEQYDVAAQKLKQAGVDTVFMTLANTFGSGLVQATANIGLRPKWLLEGNQTTDTVTKFFASVKQDLDGAVGVGFAFAAPADITPLADQCNKVIAIRSGQKYVRGSDAYGFAAIVCRQLKVLQAAGAKVGKATLNQGSLIRAIEGLKTIQLSAGPDGTLSPTKHDGGNAVYLCDFKASVGKCVRRSTPPIRLPD